MPHTVLIVDDHAGFRLAARALLEADGFVVVGESATGGEGLEAVVRLRPDVVLLDVGLPDLDGIEVSERLKACPDAPAVVLTSSRDRSDYPPYLEDCPGSVHTITSSWRIGSQTSARASNGTGSHTTPSHCSIPAARHAFNASSSRTRAAARSALPGPAAGITSVAWIGPRSLLWTSASMSSSAAAVRLASTIT
jgi:two-component system response regulator EvgA